jgi:broad specificity phosphatase PhoE
MSLYVVRHGQTDWNKERLIQGRIDIPLNEEGIKQARITKKKLEGIELDAIYVSPLTRAKQTAAIIAEGRNVPLFIDERIQEEYYGDLEGKPRSGEIYLKQRQSFFKRYPHGEGYLDVVARVYPFLNEIKEKHKGQNVLLVCHGGMSRVINTYFFDMENDEFVTFGLDNCEIAKYEFVY